MHGSRNFIFVAGVPSDLCGRVESELIWRGRDLLHYNNLGKKSPPSYRIELKHGGDVPEFSGFELWDDKM